MFGIIPAFDQVGLLSSNEHPLLGRGPIMFWGTIAPDGDAAPWKEAYIGSQYTFISATASKNYVKVANGARDDDWAMAGGVIRQRVLYTEFTDGGAAVGTKNMTETIPAGAKVMQTLVHNVTGFAGDTSATLTVGDGSDVDRYNTGVLNVFQTITALDGGVVSGTKIHTTAATVTLTVTSASDFTAVNAGAMTVTIYYQM